MREWSFIFTCTIKGRWGFCGFFCSGVSTSQSIPLVGLGKARVVIECNLANRVGWNVASRFGFEFWIVGWKAKESGMKRRVGLSLMEWKSPFCAGSRGWRRTINEMWRKVAERSAALEWNGEKRNGLHLNTEDSLNSHAKVILTIANIYYHTCFLFRKQIWLSKWEKVTAI